MNRKSHWEEVYRTKAPDEVSWYQRHSELSLALIRDAAPGPDAALLDVGGGAATLVDDLLADGFRNVSVLDISAAALFRARERLGEAAERVRWIEADVLEYAFSPRSVDVWHDRAAFHFLTSPNDRRRYVEQLHRALKPRGDAIIASFAEDGPERCSGLEVRRYSPESMQAELGEEFRLRKHVREIHTTPAGKEQSFVYCVFVKL